MNSKNNLVEQEDCASFIYGKMLTFSAGLVSPYINPFDSVPFEMEVDFTLQQQLTTKLQQHAATSKM